MPTYEYVCKNCGHGLEELQSMTEPPLEICPSCKQPKLARVMGAGSGLIFKGSGFYLTDYKGDPKKSSTTSEKKEEKKSDTTPASTSTETSKETKTPPPSSDKK